jgi:xanthine dehydrogenase YagR molybdenum-binding subunit
MKFDKPAEANPIDRMQVVGRAHPRIDGHLKTTGKAPYAYEHHDVVTNPAYGVIVGSAIGKGRIVSKSLAETERASGVLAVVTAENAGKLGKGKFNTAKLLGGPDIDHYHQAIAVVVAETFEQATAAAALIRVEYAPADGRFDLEEALKTAPLAKDPNSPEKDAPPESRTGDFEKAFAQAPVKLDELYTTPDQSHSMMEPHASIAVWNGDKLTVWTSNQMIDWGRTDLATTLGIPKENVRFVSPYIGGGFGCKLFLRSDAVMAALGAKASGRPVKVALPRPFIPNNTTHRPATRQRIRIGAGADGRIIAIAHESGSGDLPDGQPETATNQTDCCMPAPIVSLRCDLPLWTCRKGMRCAPPARRLE